MRATRVAVRAFLISLVALSLSVSFIFAQEKKPAMQDEASAEPDILWLWGEVSSIDADKGLITVKYLDYETDTEKEAAIYTDAKTAYENVSAISDIKPKDIVSVDYITGAQGSNMARNISVEKPEESPAMDEGAAPALPAEVSSGDAANTAAAPVQQ